MATACRRACCGPRAGDTRTSSEGSPSPRARLGAVWCPAPLLLAVNSNTTAAGLSQRRLKTATVTKTVPRLNLRRNPNRKPLRKRPSRPRPRRPHKRRPRSVCESPRAVSHPACGKEAGSEGITTTCKRNAA